MVLGMAAPPMQPKPQPKPQLKVETNPVPEFMWCQRADRVFLTIKVADCKNVSISVSEDNGFEFRGTGHGMCGQRDYVLSVELAQPVIASECCWFVSGPNVRARLQKLKVGPHWPGLLKGNRKMVQLKVDWSSWLDEDEEHEASAAPTGFDVPAMKMMMVGSDKDPLYRDLDKFSSSDTPDEGEETNSILIDEGMNSIDDLQIKFKALEYEKEETAVTKAKRYALRKATREAQLYVQQRERDLRYGRPVRGVTEEEKQLIANADGLYERLKEEKAVEKKFWLSKWWHQRRPEKRKIDIAYPLCLAACRMAIDEELEAHRASGAETMDAKARRHAERRVFLKARQAALDKFNEWQSDSTDPQRKQQDAEGKEYTARDMAARLTREEMALSLGEAVPELAKSMQLKQFADPRPENENGPLARADESSDGDDESTDGEEDDEGWQTVKEKKPLPEPAAPPLALPAPPPQPVGAEAAEEEGELELEGNDGDNAVLELEENDGAVLELEENDGAVLELEENDGNDDDDDDGGGLQLEENPAPL